MTNRENSIEAAKNLVSTQFNSVNASYGMLKGDNGYAYETKAPNDVAKQLVDFDHNSIHDIIGLCSGRLTKPY